MNLGKIKCKEPIFLSLFFEDSVSLWGYGIFGGGGGTYRDTGYLNKIFRDIEHNRWGYKPPELTGYGIFRPKGYGILYFKITLNL